MNVPSCWRTVYQCKSCTYKYKEKPKYCISKDGKCKNTNFYEVKVYCLDKILSFNCFVNIIVGGRRIGKTFSTAELCVNRYLKNNSKFIWTRRFKTEMKSAVKSFIKLGYKVDKIGVYYEDIIKEEKIVKDKVSITSKTNKIYIGRLATISTASRIRGDEFNDYNTLIIDEYGDEAGTSFRKEFLLINSLITSIIDEKGDGLVIVLSNNVNRFLPLYEHAEVKWDQEWTYNWEKDVVCHVVDTAGRLWKGKSAKWLASTDYFEYAINNKALDNDKELIEKYKLDYLTPLYCFALTTVKYSLFKIDDKTFVINICKNCQHDITAIDIVAGIDFKVNINKAYQLQLIELYLDGKLYFTLPLIKEIFLMWIKGHLHLLST